jgi:hypothetical protein
MVDEPEGEPEEREPEELETIARRRLGDENRGEAIRALRAVDSRSRPRSKRHLAERAREMIEEDRVPPKNPTPEPSGGWKVAGFK